MDLLADEKKIRTGSVILGCGAIAVLFIRPHFSIPVRENLIVAAIMTAILALTLFLADPVVSSHPDKTRKVHFVRTMILGGVLVCFLYYYAFSILRQVDVSVKMVLPVIHKFEDFINPLFGWEKFRFFAGDPQKGMESRHLFIYFPATYIFFHLFSLFSKNSSLPIYLCSFGLYFFFYAYKNLRVERTVVGIQDGLVCLFFSFPTMFVITTGNIEGIVFICLSLFVLFYQKKKWIGSSFFLGLAIAMKLYPAVLAVLFLSDRRYKPVLYTIGFVVLATLFPLLIFDGGFNGGILNYYHRLMGNLARYNEIFILKGIGIAWGNSLFNALRILWAAHFPEVPVLIRPWLALAAVAFLLVSSYVVFWEKVFWKKMILLLVAMNTLPFVSADYKLLHFFIPLFLLVNENSDDRLSFGYLFLLCLLLIPKNYFDLYDRPGFGITFVLDPLIMVAIAAIIVTTGLRNRSPRPARSVPGD